MSILLFRIAAALCFLAVVLGAFGAHALRAALEGRRMLDVWNKAVFYQFVHAIALLVLALYGTINRGACLLLLMGIFLFSGSLYLLALTNHRWLGAVTPRAVCVSLPAGRGLSLHRRSRHRRKLGGRHPLPLLVLAPEPVRLLDVTQKNYSGGLLRV
jgi:uncharacterized membrane protein YgdD (TMEM256/DUF423 family)